MSPNKSASYHSNEYNAQAACEHCDGIISHERWCPTLNPVVSYACKIVVSPGALTIGDAIILHSLGVRWGPSPRPNPVLRLTINRLLKSFLGADSGTRRPSTVHCPTSTREKAPNS
jgi:hypothetical protein